MDKVMDREEVDELMEEFFSTRSYDKAKRWQDTPDTAEDPIDEDDEDDGVAPPGVKKGGVSIPPPGLARK